MQIALFCHSLRSDWNHGNAHFLRGVVTELVARGHDVCAFEPLNGWSATNLAQEHGDEALADVKSYYPAITSRACDLGTLDLDEALDGATLVLVHEWSDPALVARVGRWRRSHAGARVLFHDTHHRSLTRPEEMRAFDLADYDGVLAFGACVRDRYLSEGWASRAWTWHEAADVRVFRPRADVARADSADSANLKVCPTTDLDVMWIGNWGDDERTTELEEYLLAPVRQLGASLVVHGVRYPTVALTALASAGADYRGWLPNYKVPEAFARARVTIHVPRRPYVEALPGIPTIRPFEALACGIPLISAPWDDVEGLFRAGVDYLVARSTNEVAGHLSMLLHDQSARDELAANGRATILSRHTCAHRVQELIDIARGLGLDVAVEAGSLERFPVVRSTAAMVLLSPEGTWRRIPWTCGSASHGRGTSIQMRMQSPPSMKSVERGCIG